MDPVLQAVQLPKIRNSTRSVPGSTSLYDHKQYSKCSRQYFSLRSETVQDVVGGSDSTVPYAYLLLVHNVRKKGIAMGNREIQDMIHDTT